MISNRPFALDPTATPVAPQAKPSPALVAQHLWQKTVSAALGTDEGREGSFWLSPPGPTLDNDLLLLLQQSLDQAVPVQSGPLSLGSNAGYQPLFEAAGARTGLAPALLAAIVGAEAESRNGAWDPNSRNPRSSAAGLTQFLDSTWIGEAQRPGTYLNGVAQANGWLTAQGRIAPQAREALLDLRFDPARRSRPGPTMRAAIWMSCRRVGCCAATRTYRPRRAPPIWRTTSALPTPPAFSVRALRPAGLQPCCPHRSAAVPRRSAFRRPEMPQRRTATG
ncbi:hypothetical protein E6W36_12600 [Hankyongella ginsenosidimutans]|uniref:Transglycosylase SLT domain-containing protein n=1 Tax=Hankyongella ginsenosidimutans TaxID=1763828 RepID=A0A4D7CBR1_9SPHN|nr:lytic transglycosylase domain-containing protein [Hankyongella ginsenosidimutans]QCI80046.1 hypothetical protein E6W36_12600 [Hankyongella ginsenosidimutans]